MLVAMVLRTFIDVIVQYEDIHLRSFIYAILIAWFPWSEYQAFVYALFYHDRHYRFIVTLFTVGLDKSRSGKTTGRNMLTTTPRNTGLA
jgi:hypothetical protein